MDRASSPIDDTLDFPEVAQAFHIANFIPVNWGIQDRISQTLTDFQFSREPQTTRWIHLALTAASELGHPDLIVRALTKRELISVGNHPLDRLGTELAGRLSSRYEGTRLSKLRQTAAVKNAGTRQARDKILQNAYHFDATGLEGGIQILVIDDIVTTGATFGAISEAIRAVLPEAKLTYFALARTDPWLVRVHLNQSVVGDDGAASFHPNAHLDQRYFDGYSQTAERKRKAPPSRPSPGASLPSRGMSRSVKSVEVPEVPLFDEEEAAPTLRRPVESRISTLRTRHPRPNLPIRIPWAKPALIGAGLLFVAMLAFLLMQEPEKIVPPPTTPSLPPLHESFTSPQPEAPPRKPRIARPESRRHGVITVPSIGLREEPSMSSPSVPDVILQGQEEVTLVRVLKADAGVDWIQVETRSGKRGWVVAPVVSILSPGEGKR
jgi:hypoxanthine phosphoribosyltransferase